MVPLSVATAKNDTNGLAAIAGDNSMRKISAPFQVAVKRSMMLRGMMRPLVPGRKPVSIGCMISALISTISPFLAVLGALTRTLVIVMSSMQAASVTITSALALQNSPLLVSAMATIFWESASLMRVATTARPLRGRGRASKTCGCGFFSLKTWIALT